MTAPTALAHESQAPTVVSVPHTFWSVWHQTDYIAKYLLDGATVEITGKQSWCYAAARHNGLLIGQRLFDEYALHTDVAIRFHDGAYFILFTPVTDLREVY
jgi:hypothetical protein